MAAAPVVHESTGEQLKPAQTVEYKYANVEVYAHPQLPGTQLRGTLTYGDGTGCSAEYDVWAIWPATPCVPDSTDPVDELRRGLGPQPGLRRGVRRGSQALRACPASALPSRSRRSNR